MNRWIRAGVLALALSVPATTTIACQPPAAQPVFEFPDPWRTITGALDAVWQAAVAGYRNTLGQIVPGHIPFAKVRKTVSGVRTYEEWSCAIIARFPTNPAGQGFYYPADRRWKAANMVAAFNARCLRLADGSGKYIKTIKEWYVPGQALVNLPFATNGPVTYIYLDTSVSEWPTSAQYGIGMFSADPRWSRTQAEITRRNVLAKIDF